MTEAVKIRTKKNLAGGVLTVFSAYAAFCALFFSERTAASVSAALKLSATAVIPTLAAFVMAYRIIIPRLTAAFAKMKRLQRFFGVSAGGLCMIFAGLISGFPMGAVVYSDLRKNGAVGEREGESLMPFTNNAGAAFLIGSVGTKMFENTLYGAALLASQTLAALLMIVFTRRERRGLCGADLSPRGQITPSSAAKAIADGGMTMIGITSFIVFFSVIGDALAADLHIGGYVGAVIRCVLEISGGMNALSSLGAFGMCLGGFSVGFSGMSVYMQCHFASGGEGMKKYFGGKLMMSALSGLLTLAFATAGESAVFFEYFGERAVGAKNAAWILGTLAFFGVCACVECALFVKTSKKTKKSEKLKKTVEKNIGMIYNRDK